MKKTLSTLWAILSHDPTVRKATRAAEATGAALLVVGLADANLTGGEIKVAIAGAAAAALGAWAAKQNAE